MVKLHNMGPGGYLQQFESGQTLHFQVARQNKCKMQKKILRVGSL